jgi:hypothetical protein
MDEQVVLPREGMARAAVLRQFAGRWIGTTETADGEQVVAVSDTPDEIFRILDEKGLPDAVVSRVPDIRHGLPIGIG